MSEDIKYNSQRVTEWDEVGDLKTVTSVDYIHQSIVTSILEGVDLSAPALTSTEIEEQRGAIQQAVQRNENTEPPISVDVDEINHRDQQITYQVRTRRVSVPITTN